VARDAEMNGRTRGHATARDARPIDRARRGLLRLAGALGAIAATRARAETGLAPSRATPGLPPRGAIEELPRFAALDEYLAGRTPAFGRLRLELPRIADNGNAVPMRVAVPGPFAEGAHVTSIRLYSEKNPYPLMASFEFPAPLARIEIDSRVRLAGTQRVTAIAQTADGGLLAAVSEVAVTISACLDGTG